MALLTIPTRTDLPAYTLQVELDGALYTLTLRWNKRAAAWFLDLSDAAGALVIAGRRVVVDWPLLRTVVKDNRPPGEFYAIDTAAQTLQDSTEPGIDELGGRVVLAYQEAE